jgi:alkylhydroperoxidase/carboxymuconolactone decarboxylase family protein YurZ
VKCARIAIRGAKRNREVTTKNGKVVIDMPEHPLKIYEDLDPKLLNLVNDTRDLALADGALPRKIKLLIAMVLDAVHGAPEGVKALSREALKAGASKEEIAEALRVAQFICGVGCVYTAASALKEVLG